MFLPGFGGPLSRVAFCLLLISVLAAVQPPQAARAADFVTRDKVGQIGTNTFYTPANQIVTPAGIHVELPGMRPQAIALSPDGKLLVTSGKTHELLVLNPANGSVL